MSCPYVPTDNLLVASGFAFGAACVALTKKTTDETGRSVPAILEEPLSTSFDATCYGTCTAVGTVFIGSLMPSSSRKALPVVLAASVCWLGYKCFRKYYKKQ